MLKLIFIFYILPCVSSYFVFENHVAFYRSLGLFLKFQPIANLLISILIEGNIILVVHVLNT